ncbi:hypothetical protein B0H13DRAFT_1985880 [Mycena leptocephala]|nr:hypothetical protein B0H13DRAFT_1985880 [Mycena leptocephala]
MAPLSGPQAGIPPSSQGDVRVTARMFHAFPPGPNKRKGSDNLVLEDGVQKRRFQPSGTERTGPSVMETRRPKRDFGKGEEKARDSVTVASRRNLHKNVAKSQGARVRPTHVATPETVTSTQSLLALSQSLPRSSHLCAHPAPPMKRMQGVDAVGRTFGAPVSDCSLPQSVADIYTPVVGAYTVECRRESDCLATATSTSGSTDTDFAGQRYATLYQWPEPEQDLIDYLPLTWGLWKMACRVRVEHIYARYTSTLIRSLVAQEASDYFYLYGSSQPDPLSFVGEEESANQEEYSHHSVRSQLPPDGLPSLASLRVPALKKHFTDIVISPAAGIPGRGTPMNPVRRAEWGGRDWQGNDSGGTATTGTLERRPVVRTRQERRTRFQLSEVGRGTPVDPARRAAWGG